MKRDHTAHLHQIFRAAIAAVQPARLIPKSISIEGDRLQLGEDIYPIDRFRQIFVAGAGKASSAMAFEVEKILTHRIADGVISTKTGHTLPLKTIRQMEAGHPLPDANSVFAAQEIAALLKKASKNDLVLYLLSGGASSLVADLPYGCSLDDLHVLSKELVNSGASIREINTVRKHLSSLKGGQSARLANGALIVTFIISDVIGNDTAVIGSGPTVPDTTTFTDAWEILLNYNLHKNLPQPVADHFNKGLGNIIPDTPKENDPVFKSCRPYIIGDIHEAMRAAAYEAEALGYETTQVTAALDGDTVAAANEWISQARPFKLRHKCCLIAGGETTTKVEGNGKGGRNQHFALAAAIAMKNDQNITLLAAGTDGTDGPTDAAGAIVHGETYQQAIQANLSPELFLANHDSYHFFERAGGHLKTGPTQTNVMDLVITLIN